jgi:DNA-binding protein HU-beta
VNKSELIEHIAKQADISKAAASRSLEALIGAVKTTLKKGGSVTVTGFGTFTAPHAWAAIRALAQRSRSRPPRCPSSAPARACATRSEGFATGCLAQPVERRPYKA